MPFYKFIAANVFATIFIGFGINAIIRPRHALEFFDFQAPTSPLDQNVVDGLMVVYGVRDIFMGLAIYAASFCGNRKALGWILLASCGVAIVDGAVCKIYAGKGEWGHWSYAPAIAVIATGILDRAYPRAQTQT